MLKLSEEDMSKAKKSQALFPYSQVIKNKGKILKGNGKCYPNKHLNVKKVKKPSLLIWRKFQWSGWKIKLVRILAKPKANQEQGPNSGSQG